MASVPWAQRRRKRRPIATTNNLMQDAALKRADGSKKLIEKHDSLDDTEEEVADDAEDSVVNLKNEIKALDGGIRTLDKEVAQGTTKRQYEHPEFVASSAPNKATVDMILKGGEESHEPEVPCTWESMGTESHGMGFDVTKTASDLQTAIDDAEDVRVRDVRVYNF